jgi:hypothetical protein
MTPAPVRTPALARISKGMTTRDMVMTLTGTMRTIQAEEVSTVLVTPEGVNEGKAMRILAPMKAVEAMRTQVPMEVVEVQAVMKAREPTAIQEAAGTQGETAVQEAPAVPAMVETLEVQAERAVRETAVTPEGKAIPGAKVVKADGGEGRAPSRVQ